MAKKLNHFELKRRLTKLEELADSNAEIDLQWDLFKSCLHGFTAHANTIGNDFFYRSRPNEDNYLFSHVDELKYKPKHLVKTKGRLNDINESMTYAAACELGTIIESRPRTNTLFTICKIQLLNKDLLFFPIGHKDRHIVNIGRTCTDRLIYEYCKNQMKKIVTNPDQYNSTIAIGKQFLQKEVIGRLSTPEKCCVSYPSVESSKINGITTFNIAITPDIFDLNFKIIEAKIYCITDESNFYMLNELNRTASIDNTGNIKWHFNLNEMAIRAYQGLRFDNSINNKIKNLVEFTNIQSI